MWGKDEDLQLIRVDIDPAQVGRICTPEVGIVGDAAPVLEAIDTGLEKFAHRADSREDELRNLRAEVDGELRERVGPQMAYLDVIREALPRDGIFVDEVTQVGFVSWYGFPVYRPRQHISAGYQGTLGYGYATALGVMAGNMDKKVVQVSGDGGIMFNIQELCTAVQYQLPLVTIIFNDKRYTNVQRQQKEWFEGRVICSDLHNPDFVKLAESFGAAAFKAQDPESLRTALRQAFDERGPSIIEVEVKEFFPPPWPFLMLPQNRREVCQ
jgi:acetolactate synthase-1/2/3 large subunit